MSKQIARWSLPFGPNFSGTIVRYLDEAGVLFIVDGIQGLGVLPLDVRGAGVGFLAAGAHKWLMGIEGCGPAARTRRVRWESLDPGNAIPLPGLVCPGPQLID